MAATVCCVVLLAFVTSGIYAQDDSGNLTITSVLYRPYLIKDSDGRYTGYLPDMFQRMGYNFTIVESTFYGRQDSNGNWNGMMKKVLDGDVDAGGFLTVVNKRDDAVDFSNPIMTVSPSIVMRKPKAEKPPITRNMLKLLEPLEFSIWLMSMLALLVTGTILYLISHFNPYEWRRMSKDREATLREAESFTCLNSFWFIVSTLFLQGYVRAPRSMGGRIVVTSWWMYVFIFVFTYLASLINLLSVGEPHFMPVGHVQSFQDLVSNNYMMAGFVPSGSTEQTFKNSKDIAMRDLYEKVIEDRERINKQRSKPLSTVTDLVDLVRDRQYPDFAAIIESDVAKYVTQQDCSMYVVNPGLMKKFIAVAFKKGSNLRHEFNSKLIRLQEAGELDALEKRWFANSRCEPTMLTSDNQIPARKFYRVDLGSFSGAILLLGIGIVIGCLVTFVEMCIFKWAEQHIDDEADSNVRPNHTQNSNDRLLPNSNNKKGGATSV